MPRADVNPARPAARTGDPRRRRTRQLLLVGGVTGLVVTSPATALAESPSTPAAPEIAVEDEPDPAPLFGADLSDIFALAHQGGARATGDQGALVSAVLEGRSEVARWDGVRIYTDGGRTELVGFHESNNATALPLDSSRPIATSHHHGVSVPTTGEADGQVIVLPTRHRASGPMTAIDLAVEPDEAVVSPVDGVVLAVDPISYQGPDTKIVIRPRGNPDVQISIIHVVDALVEPGDRVRGGESLVAAAPRQLAFESQIDRFTEAARGAPAPHVHVEMREIDQALT